jgi:putative serine protease PepD
VTPTPQEPPTGGPDDENEGGSGDEAESSLRGWIDPDDRLWRHPSEVAAGLATLPPHSAHHSRIMILVGATAALAAVAWVVVLLSPGLEHPATGGRGSAIPPVTTLAAHVNAIPVAATAAGRSMVALRAVTDHGVVLLAGIAVAEGGLVATTADGLKGLRGLDMVGTDGRLYPASVTATDPASDIALVTVPQDLPVAPFADDQSLAAGSADMTLSLSSPGGSALALRCTPGSVTAVAQAITGGAAGGMPGITSTPQAVGTQAGDVLLNPAGDVVGLLYTGTTGAGAAPTYLPTHLVLGVADDLRSNDRVQHGWLGVEGTDAGGPSGAQVATVMAGSPAAGRLHAGEVIQSVNSLPTRTMAELRGRLYALAPATPVVLSVVDGSSTSVVDITLSASP